MHSLREGNDTGLEDEGWNVSAGEKQLMTIAGAFPARPSVLTLTRRGFGGLAEGVTENRL